MVQCSRSFFPTSRTAISFRAETNTRNSSSPIPCKDKYNACTNENNRSSGSNSLCPIAPFVGEGTHRSKIYLSDNGMQIADDRRSFLLSFPFLSLPFERKKENENIGRRKKNMRSRATNSVGKRTTHVRFPRDFSFHVMHDVFLGLLFYARMVTQDSRAIGQWVSVDMTIFTDGNNQSGAVRPFWAKQALNRGDGEMSSRYIQSHPLFVCCSFVIQYPDFFFVHKSEPVAGARGLLFCISHYDLTLRVSR